MCRVAFGMSPGSATCQDEVLTVPAHRSRPIRVVGFAWFAALLIAAGSIGGLGNSRVLAAGALPPAAAHESSNLPAEAEPCDGGDSTGPLPSGVQTISGHVTDSVGASLPDIQVRITSTAGGMDGSTFTNAEGDYAIEFLGDGTFFVGVYDATATYGSGFFDGAGQPLAFSPSTATAIVLSGSGASAIDMAMPDETLGSISGTVTDPDGSVPDAALDAQARYFPLIGCATSDIDGLYTMSDLRRGAYAVKVSAPGQPNGWYTDLNPTGYTAAFAEATEVAIGGDVTGIDIAFPETYTLTGTVSDVDGPVQGIGLSACLVTGNLCAGGASDENGLFEIPVLVEGTYRIFEVDESGNNLYLSGYYAGEDQFSPNEGDALPVAVPGGPIRVLAVAAPALRGTITNDDDEGIPAVGVNLCDADFNNCFQGQTDGAGDYVIGVPVAGTYTAQLIIEDSRYPNGGYVVPDGGVVSPELDDALAIVIGGSDVTGVDAVIPDGGQVEMTFTSGGQPAAFAAWQVCRTESICPDGGNADDFGVAISPAQFPGTYYVSATPDIDWFWYVEGGVGSADFGDATPIAVTANTVTSIVADLPGPGAVTPEGEDVEVPLVDSHTGEAPVTLTFDEVTGSGTSSLTVSETGDPVPNGFQLGLPATYYEITTTATFSGQIEVCISYADVTFNDPSGVRLYHFDASAPGWVDITNPPIDTLNQLVCGLTTSLSPFVLVERSYAFGGFFGSKAPPQVNEAKAGATVGIQFSLGGNLGLDVFAPASPSVRTVNCATLAPLEAAAAASGTLKFNVKTGRYTYAWTSAKAWKNTCRELTLTFRDGSSATVVFRFKA